MAERRCPGEKGHCLTRIRPEVLGRQGSWVGWALENVTNGSRVDETIWAVVTVSPVAAVKVIVQTSAVARPELR